jgi:hypothetical protein
MSARSPRTIPLLNSHQGLGNGAAFRPLAATGKVKVHYEMPAVQWHGQDNA